MIATAFSFVLVDTGQFDGDSSRIGGEQRLEQNAFSISTLRLRSWTARKDATGLIVIDFTATRCIFANAPEYARPDSSTPARFARTASTGIYIAQSIVLASNRGVEKQIRRKRGKDEPVSSIAEDGDDSATLSELDSQLLTRDHVHRGTGSEIQSIFVQQMVNHRDRFRIRNRERSVDRVDIVYKIVGDPSLSDSYGTSRQFFIRENSASARTYPQ